jgi:uncharacterized phage protein (TIGR01671 family)
MDRFKFRARLHGKWLHGYESMREGCGIKGETMLLGGWMSEVKLEDLNDVIVEQCTGLRDKNGKLIYEGDIVRISTGFNFLSKAVSWGEHRYHIGNTDIILCPMEVECWNIEIIGNIHENPELLEA